MAKLDTELNSLLTKRALSIAHPDEVAFRIDPSMKIPVNIQFTGTPDGFAMPGLELRDSTGQVAHAVITLEVLERLSEHPSIISIHMDRPSVVQLHRSVPDLQANQVWTRTGNHFAGYNGSGVIIGIIDTGIDFRHRSFRRPDGKTRILKIWDQTINAPLNPPHGGETIPGPITTPATLATPLGYGVVYDAQQINDTLESDTPAVPVRHVDGDGHGTHVAGIAVGNGKEPDGCSGEFHHIGVAPDADLVVVRLWGLSDGDNGSKMTPPANPLLSAPGNLVSDALKFILNEGIRETKPVVINCSFGLFSELMDGTDPTSQTINTLLTAHSTGTSIVIAAGNDGNRGFHAVGTVPASAALATPLKFKIFPSDTKTRNLVIIYSGNNLEVQVKSPVGGANGTVAWVTGASGNSTTANGAGGSVIVTRTANRIGITITPPPATGTPPVAQSNIPNTLTADWQIELRNTSATDTHFHAFCLYGSSHDRKSPKFLNSTTTNTTFTQTATGKECVTVGSYEVGGQLAPSSGRGPTLATDGRIKPEICAPGVSIMSASIPKDREDGTCESCCCACCQDWYVSKGGTSMAAPHVAGLIALLFHKNPTLTHTEVKTLLTGNFNPRPGDATPADVTGWGAGKASAKKVVDAATQVNAPVAFTAAAAELAQPVKQILLDTEFGKSYLDLGERYFKEIIRLINHNRRVATAWHRSRGPVWTRLAIQAFHDPAYVLSLAGRGQKLSESIDGFVETLKAFASPGLKEKLFLVRKQLNALPEKITLMELIQYIGSRPLETVVATSQPAKPIETGEADRTVPV